MFAKPPSVNDNEHYFGADDTIISGSKILLGKILLGKILLRRTSSTGNDPSPVHFEDCNFLLCARLDNGDTGDFGSGRKSQFATSKEWRIRD